MAKQSEKIYVDGLFVEQKETSFGKIDKLSVQADKFIAFINQHKNEKGYVNIDLLESRKGGKYAVLNTFQPKPKTETVDITGKDEDSDLPF